MTLTAGTCWQCGCCGEVVCYDAATIAEYGEPSECGECCAERLAEMDDYADGLAAVADKALLRFRSAKREMENAKAHFASCEAAARQARQQEKTA